MQQSVALTLGQRLRLLKDCLPAAFFILALIVVPWALEATRGTRPPKALHGRPGAVTSSPRARRIRIVCLERGG